MAFETFDLGRVLQTAAAIKGMRNQEQDDTLRRQYLQTNIAGAQQQQQFAAQNQQQQMSAQEAKLHYFQNHAIETAPDPVAAAKQLTPDNVAKYEAAHGPGSFDQLTPDQVRGLATYAKTEAGAIAGITPKVEWKDAGNQLVPLDEWGNLMKGIAPIAKAASPDAQLTAQTSTANNQRTVAATLAGQKTSGADKGIPSGYERDPANPAALRPIKGGPHDPDAVSGGMDSRSSVMFNRVAASAQSASKAIQNIMELPVTTSSGFFGTAEPGHGLMSSVKNVLAQKVTGQEAQDFKTMVAGVSRNLSTIETAGLAPNGAITNSMNAVLLGEGDTQMTKLRKMAEMRQIVEENLKPQLANPKLAPAQKDLVRSIIGSVQQAVPFTHHDITLLQQSKNPNATIADFATQSGLPKSQSQGAEVTATGPNGEKIVVRNGQWVPQ